jgi:hypothetical protein
MAPFFAFAAFKNFRVRRAFQYDVEEIRTIASLCIDSLDEILQRGRIVGA